LRLVEKTFSVKVVVDTTDHSQREKIVSLSGEEKDVAEAKSTIQELIRTGSLPLSLLRGHSVTIHIEIPGHKGIILFVIILKKN
jgi:hypothetical protein